MREERLVRYIAQMELASIHSASFIDLFYLSSPSLQQFVSLSFQHSVTWTFVPPSPHTALLYTSVPKQCSTVSDHRSGLSAFTLYLSTS